MTGGAGNASPIVQQNLYGVIQIGTIDTDIPLQGLSITVGGRERVNIQNAALCLAYCKWTRSGLLGADVKIANAIPVTRSGRGMGNVSLEARLTNNGVTTPAVYGHSRGRYREGLDQINIASTTTIQASSNQLFVDFDMLAFIATNLNNIEVEFDDGWNDRFQPDEIAELFNQFNDSDADGKLGTCFIIDNLSMRALGYGIRSVRVYTDSGGTLTVLRVAAADLATDF